MLEDKVTQSSPSLQSFGHKRSVANSQDKAIEDMFSDINEDNETQTTDAQKEVDQRQSQNDGNSFMQHIAEIPPSIGSGLAKATQELGNFAIDVADWVDDAAGAGLIDPDQRITALTNPDNVFQPETGTGKVVREITSFLLPFGAASKAAKGIQATSRLAKFTKAGAIGFGVDFAAYDPHEERLSNLIQKAPELANPVSEYLAADRKDSRAEGRFKNALEGMLLGTGAEFLIEGLTRGVKAVKGSRVANNVLKDTEALAKKADEAEIDVTGDEVDGLEELSKAVKEERDGAIPEVDASRIDEVQSNIPTPKQIDEQVEQLSFDFEAQVEESRRGVISDEVVDSMATKLGVTREDLLGREIGEALNAETLLGQAKYIDTAVDELNSLQKAAINGSDADKAAFLARFQQYVGERAHFLGATAEAGRSLRAARIAKNSLANDEKARFIDDYLKMGGGKESVDEILTRMEGFDAGQFSDVAKRSVGRFLKDAVFETWINSLLSGPRTHLTNILSNSTVVASSIAETGFARASSLAFGSKDSVQEGELYAQLSGLMAGINDGISLAAESFRTGQPSSVGTKLDELPVRTISPSSVSETFPQLEKTLFDEEGGLTIMGKGVQILGDIVGIPSRFLLAEDEFFKAVHMRSQVHQLATRQGRLRQAAEGLSDEQTMSVIKDLIDNPPADITSESMNVAKRNTFTNDLQPGSFSQKLNDLIKTEIGGIAPLRAVLPFIRTPINILEFAWDRTPFRPGKLMSDMKAGGVRRDTAIARVGLGTSVMATMAMMAGNGMVTGRGPGNVKSRKFLENSGWQPYSFKVGDNYIQYDRLDPWGQVVGMAADMSTVFQEVTSDNRDDAETVLATGLGMMVENMTPEFMTENLSNFLEIFQEGREKNRAVTNFLTNLGSSTVPFSGLMRDIRKIADPTKRELRAQPEVDIPLFDETVNKVMNNIPGLSDNLPPKRNMFGDEIHYPGSFSPIAVTKDKKDPVVNEMIELGMNSVLRNKETRPGETHLVVDMPPRFIQKRFAGKSVNVNLTNEQYDKFVQYSAGIGLKQQPIPGKNLREAIGQEIKTQRLSRSLSGGGKPTDEAKRLAIKQLILTYRKAGKAQLLREEQSIFDEFLEESKKRQDAFNPTNFR